MIDNKATGRMIAKLRQAQGLTQQQLAGILCVSHQAVSKWESGATLPDIQTMVALTRFFGITMEQLIFAEDGEDVREDAFSDEKKEMKHMSIQQLLMIAPFMSKEAVEEIAMTIETPLTDVQLAKLAPHLHPEALETLIEMHGITFTWESLKKIAPFMSRESIDNMARKIARGEQTISHEPDYFDKAKNDISKAFDNIGKDMGKAMNDIGKGVGKAINKAVKIGGVVLNDVTDAFSDSKADEADEEDRKRVERIKIIRKKAFERAMADERWDWIAAHISEIESETELRARIAEKAFECGMSAWVCEHMGAYADTATIEQAIADENWSWLSECTWLFTPEMQKKTAIAAKNKGNWAFLSKLASQLNFGDCTLEIAEAALDAGECALVVQLAGQNLNADERNQLVKAAFEKKSAAMLEGLVNLCEKNFLEEEMQNAALSGDWSCIEPCLRVIGSDCIEKLMDIAVDQGNFEVLDILDNSL